MQGVEADCKDEISAGQTGLAVSCESLEPARDVLTRLRRPRKARCGRVCMFHVRWDCTSRSDARTVSIALTEIESGTDKVHDHGQDTAVFVDDAASFHEAYVLSTVPDDPPFLGKRCKCVVEEDGTHASENCAAGVQLIGQCDRHRGRFSYRLRPRHKDSR